MQENLVIDTNIRFMYHKIIRVKGRIRLEMSALKYLMTMDK